MGSDWSIVIRFWGVLFLCGAAAYPLTRLLFSSFYDKGYLYSKALGIALVSYLVYLMGTLHLFAFTTPAIVISLGVVFGGGLLLQRRKTGITVKGKREWVLLLLEEFFFFGAFVLWAWVKGHEPSIRGLEKFMDYGFMKSILESTYFPPGDMWWAGFPINYYYFGHLVVAVLTKLSGLDLAYTFNLMLAAIFAFTATMSFGIGYQLSYIRTKNQEPNSKRQSSFSVLNLPFVWILDLGIWNILSGLLTAFLVTLAGNMQTIYAFTKGYTGENVVPFWTIMWQWSELWQKIPEGLNKYWYANATRFIPFTIHEFPSYSFVVSDVHGHVLSLPFVLLAIALLVQIFSGNDHGENSKFQEPSSKLRIKGKGFKFGILGFKFVWLLGFGSWNLLSLIVYGFLVGVLLMTNALDGPIYGALFVFVWAANAKFQMLHAKWWKQMIVPVGLVGLTAGVTSLPFLSHFSSFVKGLAINCPPAYLANKTFGPFLFEAVEKCQHSPFWMLWLLWGFFVFCGVFLIGKGMKSVQVIRAKAVLDHRIVVETKYTHIEKILLIFFGFSILLLIFPEFFYFKDIYPAHFRSNTMFKLGYEAFILLSIMSGYTIIQWLQKCQMPNAKCQIIKSFFILLLIPQLFLISIYPIFSVRSYFNSLSQYQGLYGLAWLDREYPDDYAAIQWLNETRYTTQDTRKDPVIVEADGDSYTDYERFSAFTGMPTVVGWAVHEWLWRGSYETVAPRREDVRIIYESLDMAQTKTVLSKYNVRYIVVGMLEKKKFQNIAISKLQRIGKIVYTRGETTIYEITY